MIIETINRVKGQDVNKKRWLFSKRWDDDPCRNFTANVHLTPPPNSCSRGGGFPVGSGVRGARVWGGGTGKPLSPAPPRCRFYLCHVIGEI
ncbi:hypothetical protein EVAR_50669_1 [Eumeta japonica]|uniref:Uncharacterized protein n=1 Tax=Eumeta variegata TaxID=151549 RepID=A0A4C1XRZ5_EUMVA|nr:hypothetical protein EVAR_50669_1 [Eumeta japonica]